MGDPDKPLVQDLVAESLIKLKKNIKPGVLMGERSEEVANRLEVIESWLLSGIRCLQKPRNDGAPIVAAVTETVEKEVGPQGILPWRRDFKPPPSFIPEEWEDDSMI